MASYKDKPKKNSTASRNIALEKMDFYNEPAPAKKKQDKIKGRPQNVFVRFAHAAFPQKWDDKGEKIRKIVLLVLIIVFAVSIGYLLYQLVGINNTESNDKAQSIAGVDSGEIDMDQFTPPEIIITAPSSGTSGSTNGEPTESNSSVPEETEEINVTPVVNTPINADLGKLIQETGNQDIKGWIKITGTYLNNAVVQGPDNSYYLTKDVFKNESINGSIYSHYRNKWDGTDENIILFGHNMISGHMFATVRYYLPNDASREPVAFYKVHPTVMIQTLDGKTHVYKIFAGMLANTQEEYGEVFHYANKTSFKDQADFNNYVASILDRSWFYTDVDLQYGDKLLTLSTCYWPLGEEIDTRWVVFAREVRAGESEYVDTTVATRNYNAKLFDYYYSLIGGQWYGSNWDKSKLKGYTG